MAGKGSSKGGSGGGKQTTTDYRSAETGKFVTEKFANTHKATTVKETRKK